MECNPGKGGWYSPIYRYVPPQRVCFLGCFGLKMGITFYHCGLKSGMAFKGTTGVYKQRICQSCQLQMNSREKELSKIYHSS